MAIKITKADVGRKVKLRSGGLGLIYKVSNNSGLTYPVKVRGNITRVNDEQCYTLDGKYQKDGLYPEHDIIAFVDEPKRKRGRPRNVDLSDDITSQVNEVIGQTITYPEYKPETRQSIAIELIKNGHEAAGVWLLQRGA